MVLVWILFAVDVGAGLVTAAFWQKAAGNLDIAQKCEIVRHALRATVLPFTNRLVYRVVAVPCSPVAWADGTYCWSYCLRPWTSQFRFPWATCPAGFRAVPSYARAEPNSHRPCKQ